MPHRDRITHVILMTLMIFSLASCQTGEQPEFRLATFQCDVTPPPGTPIYSGYEPLEAIEHPLMAKGIVIESSGERYVLCVLDWCEICNSTHTLFREALAEAAGTSPANVAVHTVHQHTAPMGDADAMRILDSLDNPPPHPAPEVFEQAARDLAGALGEALAGLLPVDRVGLGRARVEGVASTRRVMAEDGSILIRWSSCRDPELRAMPEGLIDPWLRTITFAYGEKPLARLHYYTTHPQSFYGDPRASYDFPGMARQRLEEEEGVFQAYFTGCAGDVTAGKYNDGSPEARERLAERLFSGMRASVEATRYEPIESLDWRTVMVGLPLNEDPGHSPEAARERMRDPELPHSSRVGAAMALSTIDRADTPYLLSALRVNDAWIMNLPGECMVDFQFFCQDQKPDGFVAVAAYGDGGPGYICTEASFGEGGYEPGASKVAPGSEKILKEGITELMQ